MPQADEWPKIAAEETGAGGDARREPRGDPMRLLSWAAGAVLLFIFGMAIATRIPAVQDAMFERVAGKALQPRQTALFDGDGLKVIFCGTSSPVPSLKRAQTCTAIVAGDQFYLVDAGTGSWEVLQAGGMPGGKIGGVFLTHFHSDHIGDLSEVNLNTWFGGRTAPLSVYGPEGVERVVAGENEALALDTLYRIAHHGEQVMPPQTAGMTAFSFDGSAPHVVFEKDGLKVTAFPVKHDPVKPAVGYRFDYKGRSVSISGDTAYSESLIENSKGVDVLIHEAQSNLMVGKMRDAAQAANIGNLAKVLSDIMTYHTTPEEAARAANEAGADWLILTHFTPPPDNPIAKRMFMRGVSKIRRDNVKMADDGLVVLLPEAGGISFSAL